MCRAIGVSNYALHLLREMESYATEMPTVHELEVHPRSLPFKGWPQTSSDRPGGRIR